MLSPYVVTAEVPLVDRSAWPIVLARLPTAYAVFGGQSCHCYPPPAQGSSQRDVTACAPHALVVASPYTTPPQSAGRWERGRGRSVLVVLSGVTTGASRERGGVSGVRVSIVSTPWARNSGA